MATSGEGILALIGGTRIRGKKRKGQGFPNFKSMTHVNTSKGGGVSVGHAGKMAA